MSKMVSDRNIVKGCLCFLICGTIVHIFINSRLVTPPTRQVFERFIINTTGCQIPKTPIFPKYYKSNWHLDKIPNCSYEKIFSTLTEDEVIVLNPEYNDSDCCLHEITRVENYDDKYNLSTCESLKTIANVSGKEILVAKCGNVLNFHVNLPTTPEVQIKLNHWKNVPVKERPPSVILFGVDTTSRSHAYRSLPQTMKFMKETGFTDFKGYHSIAAGTFHNFVAFLMGLQKKATAKCSPKWNSPYDTCPFIWKDFARQYYVTMYVEDGHQTFNWGGQGGFQKRPTDYYIHSLFQSIEDFRNNYSSIGPNSDLECTSNETIPEFLVRYTRRFATKFRDVPFFSFTWFANPFHDNQFTLGTLDEEIHSFIQLLNGLPNFLERTLVIFIGDHGDRYGDFQQRSLEGYIERGLPPFFMRIPEVLKNRFPDVEETLYHNSRALTSGFDIHHTFKHILSLSDNNANANADFEPVMEDRSSLFLPIDLNRTCSKINIYSENCVCGSGTYVEPLENPYLLSKVMYHVIRKLNGKFSSPKYKNICKSLKAKSDNIISTQILKKTANSTDTLIQFKPYTADAIFEVKIKVFYDESNFGGCKMIGDFQRVNSYGNQSSCVELKTDEDKKMKEFCICTRASLEEKLKSDSVKLKSSKLKKRRRRRKRKRKRTTMNPQ